MAVTKVVIVINTQGNVNVGQLKLLKSVTMVWIMLLLVVVYVVVVRYFGPMSLQERVYLV